eukprot:2756681-Pyramimonas_sp.AAC.2
MAGAVHVHGKQPGHHPRPTARPHGGAPAGGLHDPRKGPHQVALLNPYGAYVTLMSGLRGEQWEKVGNWTKGEKRGRAFGVLSAPLPLLLALAPGGPVKRSNSKTLSVTLITAASFGCRLLAEDSRVRPLSPHTFPTPPEQTSGVATRGTNRFPASFRIGWEREGLFICTDGSAV